MYLQEQRVFSDSLQWFYSETMSSTLMKYPQVVIEGQAFALGTLFLQLDMREVPLLLNLEEFEKLWFLSFTFLDSVYCIWLKR